MRASTDGESIKSSLGPEIAVSQARITSAIITSLLIRLLLFIMRPVNTHARLFLPHFLVPITLVIIWNFPPPVVLDGPAPQLPDDYIVEGYDCSHPTAVLDMSFSNPEYCPAAADPVETQHKAYVLLQREVNRKVDGYRCRVKLTRTVNYCGNFDHQTNYPDYSFHDREVTFSAEACREAVENKKVNLGESMGIDQGDNRNSPHTAYVNVPGVGHIVTYLRGFTTHTETGEVYCGGDTWHPPGADTPIEDVVVTDYYKFEIEKERYLIQDGTIRALADNVILGCEPQDRKCTTGTATYIWDSLDDKCPLARTRDVVTGTKARDAQGREVFMSTDGSLVRFVIQDAVTFPDCDGAVVSTTNYNDLYLAEVEQRKKFKRDVDPSQVELSSYVRNRDDYLYTHLREAVADEFRHVLQASCEENARRAKKEFFLQHVEPRLYTYLLGNGTFAISAGEVIYQYTCKRVLAKAVNKPICYRELPVRVLDNSSRLYGHDLFLDPLTHQLSPDGQVVPCSSIFAPKFQNFRGQWIQPTPDLRRCEPPAAFTNPADIAKRLRDAVLTATIDPSTGGIYTDDTLRDHMRILNYAREGASIDAIIRSQTHRGRIHGVPLMPAHQLLENLPDLTPWHAGITGFFVQGGKITSILLFIYAGYVVVFSVLKAVFTCLRLKRLVGTCDACLYAFCADTFLLNALVRGDKEERDPPSRSSGHTTPIYKAQAQKTQKKAFKKGHRRTESNAYEIPRVTQPGSAAANAADDTLSTLVDSDQGETSLKVPYRPPLHFSFFGPSEPPPPIEPAGEEMALKAKAKTTPR